ncbi:family 43 glycosylhydrolase [Glycomyces harbinensis]|uniref:Beta-xylosidase, GH43 family n=1 Tax=Glycomyces harbinensis TaxID=58114 RepID=A0A1G7BG05_9ACTN|nr:family 43 glycosylhydrolase [Glycomyces harbinensis]SDE25902.1 Beta-xylosidase, GH43 family [Glycomyces harbinensis]
MHRAPLNRRRLFQTAGAAALVTAASTFGIPAPASAAPGVLYSNALVQQRADPHIVRHTDGHYYFTASVPAYDRIIMRRSTTLQGLATAQESTIWSKHSSGPMSHHIWAPEIHYIDGKWYVYFAAGRADDIWAIRMYVLENAGANPMSGTWTERGQIALQRDSFSLDATTFTNGSTRYLCWAQSDPELGSGTSLYLAAMSNPWTITGTPVRISKPTNSWEVIGHKVNEGAAVVKRNGRIFMTFSASATDANYAVGLLTASQSANLLSASSWTKSAQPVLRSNDNTSQFGPGHNSFTVSEDGQSDILVYHARPYKAISGDPLYDPNRHTRIQKFYWNADGTPNFGVPVADGATPYRFAAYGASGVYLNHWEFRLRANATAAMLADSQFRIVTGLAGSGTVSLESANYPGYYLRHKNYEIWVERSDGTALFRSDASFHRRSGLADSGAVSFEASNAAGRYLRHVDGLAYVQTAATDAERAAATFRLE